MSDNNIISIKTNSMPNI